MPQSPQPIKRPIRNDFLLKRLISDVFPEIFEAAGGKPEGLNPLEMGENPLVFGVNPRNSDYHFFKQKTNRDSLYYWSATARDSSRTGPGQCSATAGSSSPGAFLS